MADERATDLPTLETDVAMPDAAGRRRLAAETLDFALRWRDGVTRVSPGRRGG